MIKIYLELNTAGDRELTQQELIQAKQKAQDVADMLGITIQLTDGNYGSWFLDPQVRLKQTRDNR